MKTLAVIPARLGATRLPRKPLRLLAGRPIVIRVWERVSAMGVAERCVIATDSEEVAAAAKAGGAEAVLTASHHPSGTDRVAEVARRSEFRKFDTIINVQGDEPFISTDAVRGAADMLGRRGRFEIGTAAVSATPAVLGEPSVVKVVAADDGRALYFSRAPIPFLREPKDLEDNAALRQRVCQHIGVYAYTMDALARWVSLPPHPLERIERLEQLRPLAAGLSIGVAVIAGPWRSGIDTETDLARANTEWTIFSGEPA